MKFMNQAKKYAAVAVGTLAAAPAFAAVDPAVTEAINTLKADVLTLGAMFFAIILAIVGFMYFRRVAK